MPRAIHKTPIADELRGSLPSDIRDIVLGGDTNPGILAQLYELIGQVSGAVEWAYRRGADRRASAGIHDVVATTTPELVECLRELADFSVDDPTSPDRSAAARTAAYDLLRRLDG